MRTAVVGMGRMGRRHLQVVRSLRLELVGVCDAVAAAVEQAGAEEGVPSALRFVDFDEMLSVARPECVVVATHAPSHCPYAVAAARSGAKAILCEKPLGVSLRECDEVVEQCRARNVRLAVNHQMRFMEQYTTPKKMAESDEFGGLTSVAVVAGNFGLAMNGAHYFEMFRYMAGEPAATVNAWFSPEKVPNPRGPQFEDRAGSVRAAAAGGKRFYMDAGADQGHGLKAIYACRYGQIVVDELTGSCSACVRKPEHREAPTTRYGMPFEDRVFSVKPADSVEPTKAVLQALIAGDDFPTGEDGRNAVAVLAACYASAENNSATIAVDDPRISRDRVFPWA